MSQSTPTGILDEYPGAAAAYSLRLLNTDYVGDAVVVRRSSDNATQNIGFVDGELDTDALNTFCSGTDGFVTTWYDQSGNGNDAIQTSASEQPKIFDSVNGIIEVEGKPSIYFDGTGDGFVSSNLAGQARLDTYFVAKPNNDDFYIYPNGGNSYGYIVISGSTITDLTNNYGTPSLYANSQLFAGTTSGQIHTFLNNTKLVVHQNASTVGWSTYNFGYYVSSSYNFDGYFSEFIAYDNDQSSNRTGIETNINDFYNIY